MQTMAGRAYMREFATPYQQNVSSLLWLLTGKGPARVDSGAMALAVSRYRPAPQILKLSAPGAPRLTRTQQGRISGGGVNTITLRDPSYSLSTTSDHNKGQRGAQAHIVQASLPGMVPVFVNSAVTTSEVSRPGYWLGNQELPRAVQEGDTAIAMYRLKDDLGFTHCFFPIPWMDRWAERGGWIAGQKEEGYVAVYSQSGPNLIRAGQYRLFEIVSTAPRNTWILRVGSREFPSLDAFLLSLPAPSFSESGVKVGGLEVSWDGPFLSGGKPVPTPRFPAPRQRLDPGGLGRRRHDHLASWRSEGVDGTVGGQRLYPNPTKNLVDKPL